MNQSSWRRAVICTLALAAAGAAVASAGDSFTTLEPGKTRVIAQEIPVNIVFVGYEQGNGDRDIDETQFLSQLPSSYNPIIRAPWYYGINESMPTSFTFKYNVVYADSDYEDDFFDHLKDIAETADVTLFQEYYNSENASPAIQITDNVCIDAPSTEHWLAAHPPDGVDTTQYTIYMINWYGRGDFTPHVYCKTDEPDPDTGYNFGEDDFHKLIAWGGTAPDDEESGDGSLARVWFYDLSAGPEYWTFNCDLDTGDLTGDGVDDYRMPPVWEYGNSGYRDFDDLSGDLGKVVRYVAINLLFTPSPIYNTALSAPKLPDDIQVDLNVYQFDDSSDANDYIDIPYFLNELAKLQPYINFTADTEDLATTNRAVDVYNCAVTFFFPPEEWDSCFGKRYFGVPLADLYLYHSDKLLQFVDGDADYEIPTFVYNLPEDMFQPFLGLADDDWSTGKPSYLYCLDSDGARAAGYGLTATIIHEAGHHLGLSHPHDGHDSDEDIEYYPDGPLWFVASGDQCNTMMSYIDLNWDFSQFDKDTMDRYMTTTYINMANAILGKVCKSSKASKVSSLLASADSDATDALDDYDNFDWSGAVVKAKSAYDKVMEAAAKINIKIEPEARSADLKARGRSDHLINPIDRRRPGLQKD